MNYPKEYLEARAFTRKWEGGFVDHPKDPGGATNKGVIQSNYDRYRDKKHLSRQSVKHISEDEANEIYFNYWLGAKCDQYKSPLSMVMFDTAINFGVVGALKFLQKALDLTPDGIFGPNTSKALKLTSHYLLALLICALRIKRRHERVKEKPSQRVFLRGWLNRDNNLMEEVCKHSSH